MGLKFIVYYLKKDFHHKFTFLLDSQSFVDALLKSNSPYFLLSKNKNFSKNKTKPETDIPTQTFREVKNLVLQLIYESQITIKTLTN